MEMHMHTQQKRPASQNSRNHQEHQLPRPSRQKKPSPRLQLGSQKKAKADSDEELEQQPKKVKLKTPARKLKKAKGEIGQRGPSVYQQLICQDIGLWTESSLLLKTVGLVAVPAQTEMQPDQRDPGMARRFQLLSSRSIKHAGLWKPCESDSLDAY
jgi:hypothetical protein